METMYLFCAVVGGTIMICQFLLTVIGFGADADADHGGDFDHGDSHPHHGGNWLFHIITFRTIIAAVTFFGASGMASLAAGLSMGQTLAISLTVGFIALLAVYWMMQSMHRFNYDGTMRIDQSVGKYGTVYTSIPANHEGSGKIQISIQEQVVELIAVTTAAQPLKPGMQVVVVSVLGGGTVEVAPMAETASVAEG
jgi:hypothetical protein